MEEPAPGTRPAGIQYGADDSTPLWQTVLLTIQYVLVIYGSLVVPALVIEENGSSAEAAAHFMALSLIVMGIGTIMQASRRLGAGYLCPGVCGAEFAPVSIMAVQQGGYPLLSGMLAVTGLFQGLLVPTVTRLRPFFPAEVTGVVVFMTGFSLIRYCLPSFFGVVNGQLFVDNGSMILAALSFAVMIAPCIWGRGVIRHNAGFIGLLCGIAAAYLMGAFPDRPLGVSGGADRLIVIPHPVWAGWAWRADMAIPFLIAGVCALLGTVGNLTVCQKSNSANGHRPDMNGMSRGVFVGAFGNLAGGVLGGAGQGSSAVSVGMSIATGVASRRIGYWVGVCCIALSFFPQVASIYALLPRPVLDASLLTGICFILFPGIRILSSRMTDFRKILIIGSSIGAGVCADVVPGIRDGVGMALRPVFSSPLSVSAIVAVGMNLLIRNGGENGPRTEKDKERNRGTRGEGKGAASCRGPR